MHGSDSAARSCERLGIRCTVKPVSDCVGLLLFRYLEWQGIWELLPAALPDGRTAPNRIPVVTQVLSLFATVRTGGQRCAYVARLRPNPAVRVL
jgi:hypothetical protein